MSATNSTPEQIITQVKVVPYSGGNSVIAKIVLPFEQVLVEKSGDTTVYLDDFLSWEELGSK